VTNPQDAATRPPLHEVAHLGHIELLTPEPSQSLWFFTDVLGLTENGRDGNSVYLRTWDDYEHHTVKLTAHDTSGIRRVGLRASSQAALEARVRAIEAAGLGIGWKDGDPGIGPTYLFRDPDGHELELYWETEWYQPPSRAAGARAGLAHDHLDRSRARQGPGLGPGDHRVLPHPRHPTGHLRLEGLAG
jgi:catechol 2,3-dioxygenase